jgi:hypothetical protein
MTMFSAILIGLKRLACAVFCTAGSLFAIRHDWPECCRDSDEMRRVVKGMRDEAWRSGL